MKTIQQIHLLLASTDANYTFSKALNDLQAALVVMREQAKQFVYHGRYEISNGYAKQYARGYYTADNNEPLVHSGILVALDYAYECFKKLNGKINTVTTAQEKAMYAKLSFQYQVFDASILVNRSRSPAWPELRRNIYKKDFSSDAGCVGGARVLGALVESDARRKKSRRLVEYAFDVMNTNDESREVYQRWADLALEILGLKQTTITNAVDSDFAEQLEQRFLQLKLEYGFSWEEMDAFMHQHFLPLFLGSLPARKFFNSKITPEYTAAESKRSAVGERVLSAYYDFVNAYAHGSAQDFTRQSAHRSLLFTQALRGERKAVRTLRGALYQFLSDNLQALAGSANASRSAQAPKPQLLFSLASYSEEQQQHYLGFLREKIYPALNHQDMRQVTQALGEIKNILLAETFAQSRRSILCFDEIVERAIEGLLNNTYSLTDQPGISNNPSPVKRGSAEARSCVEEINKLRDKGQSPYKDNSSGVFVHQKSLGDDESDGLANGYASEDSDVADRSPSKMARAN